MKVRGEKIKEFSFRVQVQNSTDEQYLVAQSVETSDWIVFGPNGEGHNVAEFCRCNTLIDAAEMAASFAVGRSIWLERNRD